jgi:hypothetical protein
MPIEGFGANAVGGSNSSTVYHVTNLNASGSGSLKGGLGSNRTIVFDVSGTINTTLGLYNYSYLTIDGAGQNITINGGGNGDVISIDGSNAHHIILKNLHVTNGGNDGINVLTGAHDVAIINCTSYGNADGNLDIAGGTKVTVQYCIIGNGKAGWSGGMLITSQDVSVHHNLFSPATSGEVGERCPLVHSNYTTPGNPCADVRNNVIWKFGRAGGTGSGQGTAIAYKATANVINNYYYTTGTSASQGVQLNDYGNQSTAGYAYVSGNVSGNSGVNLNNQSNHAIYPAPAVTTQDACSAAALVLANAGPVTRNSVDNGYISAVTLPNCAATPPPTNQAPIVSAGSPKTVTLPTNSVTLTGTASDPDGSIASYAWTKTSGPAATIASPSSISTNVTGLTAGTYVFNLRVTDNKGATANSNVTVTVGSGTPPPNQSPVVSAGSPKTVTLPTNSVTLTGTASDPDGTIASYAWTKTSGPAATIASPSSITTNVTGLTAGTYVFNLKVTDNKGATANSNVTVTVGSGTPPPNQSPVVNAGNPQTITLPTSTVSLSGSATDPDGTIFGYFWTKVSGNGATITSPTSKATTVTGLSAGSYVFNLRATDNKGAVGNKTVTITVNAANPPGGGYGTLFYSQGYDASNSVNTSNGRRNTRSTSKYVTGPGSFRTEVRYGDNPERGEMIYTGSAYNAAEEVIEYDVYYENWRNFGGGGSTIMWQPTTPGAMASLGLQNYEGTFKVVRALGSTVVGQTSGVTSVISNKWYKMRWEVKWSTSSTGYIRLYIDNVLYYSFTGITADNSGTPNMRVGQYRWSTTSGSTSVVYYDNLKVYRK